jgi:hypothetical protein
MSAKKSGVIFPTVDSVNKRLDALAERSKSDSTQYRIRIENLEERCRTAEKALGVQAGCIHDLKLRCQCLEMTILNPPKLPDPKPPFWKHLFK